MQLPTVLTADCEISKSAIEGFLDYSTSSCLDAIVSEYDIDKQKLLNAIGFRCLYILDGHHEIIIGGVKHKADAYYFRLEINAKTNEVEQPADLRGRRALRLEARSGQVGVPKTPRKGARDSQPPETGSVSA